MVEYRSTCHIFGCTSSPAVANYALKFWASKYKTAEYRDAQRYISQSFYVDDGLYSSRTTEKASDILEKSRSMLDKIHVRLHKIISNSREVLNHFPPSEVAMQIEDHDLQQVPIQRTLGVAWNTRNDTFTMNVTLPERPFTKRGVIAVINTIYDPIGIVSPVTLTGRLIQREILPQKGTNKENGHLPV